MFDTSSNDIAVESHEHIFNIVDMRERKLVCEMCLENVKIGQNQFFQLPKEVFEIISLEEDDENSIDILVRHRHNQKLLLMRVFMNLNYESKKYKKMMAFWHENVQKVIEVRKNNEKTNFALIFEYFAEDFPILLGNGNHLCQILDGIEHIYSINGFSSCYKGFSKKGLKIENNVVKIMLSNREWLYIYGDKDEAGRMAEDIKYFGLLAFEMITGKNCDGNHDLMIKEAEQFIGSEDNKDELMKKLLINCLYPAKQASLSELKKICSQFSSKIPIRNLKRASPLHYLSSFPNISLLNLSIVDKKDNLSKVLDIYSMDFFIQARNMLSKSKIKALKVHFKPDFSQVSPSDDWRSFWWYAFYHHKSLGKTFEEEIAITVKSTNDWDNGLPEDSINMSLSCLNNPLFRKVSFERLELIFHSYLAITGSEINKIRRIIDNYRFPKLKHFELVISSENGEKKYFEAVLNSIKAKSEEIGESLETFSVLFNSICDLNACVEKIGNIAAKLENLKVFRFWIGNVSQSMDTSAINNAFSPNFLSKLEVLGIGFNSWKAKPYMVCSNVIEMLKKMRLGLSKRLQELHIWLWSCDTMELSKEALFSILKERNLFFNVLNLYFEGWAKKIDSEDAMKQEVIDFLKAKSQKAGESLLRAKHIKLYLKQ